MAEIKQHQIADEKEIANKRVVVPEISVLVNRAQKLIGRNLTLADFDKMPTCADFRDPETEEYVDASIAANKCIVFSSVKMMTGQWADQNGDWRFRFIWHGRGIDGRVMLLVINDVFPSMYIKCPNDMTEIDLVKNIKRDISILGITLASEPSITHGKPLVGYQQDTSPFVRLSFIKPKDYDAAISHFKSVKHMIVANTDFTKSRMYLQAVRESGVDPAGMNSFKYVARGNPFPAKLVSDIDEIFTVSIKDIKPWKPPADEKRIAFHIPRLFNLNFDIETGSEVRGQALFADREDTHSHVLSFTIRYNRKDYLRVSLTTCELVQPKAGYIQFICSSELQMFLIFANCIRRLRPAIITTYNGDNFDWRFIVTKIGAAGLTQKFFGAMDFFIPDHEWIVKKGLSAATIQDKIMRSYMRDAFIKISADEMKCPIYYPELISFLNMDIFTMCKRKWPSSKFSEKSLNAFLAKVGEPPKYDMPAWRQFDIYEEMLKVIEEKKLGFSSDQNFSQNDVIRKYFMEPYKVLDNDTIARLAPLSNDLRRFIEDITNVNVYCVFDTISALDLCDRAGLLTEMIIVGQQYMCTPNEAIYLAKGGLVMDKAVYSGFQAKYFDCDEPIDTLRGFPGAKVLHPPIRGLTTITPRISDRVQIDSRWAAIPSAECELMVAIMISHWSDEMNHPDVNTLSPAGLKLFREMLSEYKNVPTVDWDFASMYPTIMAEHNSSPERLVRTDEEVAALRAKGIPVYTKTRILDGREITTRLVKTPYGRGEDGSVIVPSPMERGIIPAEQESLRIKRADKRKELKIKLAELKKLKDANPGCEFPIEEAMCDRLEAEQLECKVAMNTMYGKLGDPNNKFFRIAISSDVTQTGQEYLEQVIEFIKSREWNRIRYGDTDSAYAEPPTKMFDDLHKLFFTEQISREAYATRMTERAITLGNDMGNEINAHLRATGSDFMRMECEGAHFPNIFIRQKRNITRLHGENTLFKPNFSADGNRNSNFFHCTGIAWKKGKAQSALFRELSSDAAFRLLDINNIRPAADVIKDVVTEAYAKSNSGGYPAEYFIQRATYKPEKHNVCVINFIERLKNEGRNPPRAYEKFEYVKIRRDNIEFNDDGCKNNVSTADFMELYSYVVENKLPIDFSKYMLGDICNELAQFMCCDPRYNAQAVDNTPEAISAAQEASLELGNKYVQELCDVAAGTLTTAIKKPVFVLVSKHTTAYMKIAAPGLELLTRPADLRMLKNIAKSNGALRIYQERIEAGAVAAANPIFNKLKTVNCVPGIHIAQGGNSQSDESVIGLLAKMSDKFKSPKILFINDNHSKRDALETELKSMCQSIDTFHAWYSSYQSRIAHRIKDMVGLNKMVITADDITNASSVLNSGSLTNIDLPPDDLSKIPPSTIFADCDRIVNDIIEFEKFVIAFDMFTEYLSAYVRNHYGAGAGNHDRARVNADIANAIATTPLNHALFDPITKDDAMFQSSGNF